MRAFLRTPFPAFFIALIGLLLTESSFGQTSQIFNTSGTFTVPANVTSVTVKAWGGGAGGRTDVRGANGGGGGAYARSVLTVVPGTNISVTVGAGGVANAAGTNSIFGASQVVAAGAPNQNGGQAGSIGQLINGGGNGGVGEGNGKNSAGGGGGSSASNAGIGVNGANANNSTGGVGGNGPDGDGGKGGDGTGLNINGQPGTSPGGGGGGKGDNGIAGTGADGRVIVYYYLFNSATASSPTCPGNPSTITISSPSLLAGTTYTINYTLSGANTGTGTASMVVSTNGTGSFTTSALPNPNNTTLTVTNITNGDISLAPSGSATASITVAPLPVSGTLTKTPNAVSVCSGTDVAATATAGSGGAGTTADVLEYRFDNGLWSTYTAGANLSTSGHTKVEIRTYRTATGTGCTSSTPVVVSWTVNPRPTVAITVNEAPLTGANDGTICTGGSVTLTGNGSGSTGPYTYSWVTGATTIATTQAVTVSPTANTDYLVTVTDGNGCTNTETFTVTVNSLPTPVIGISENPLIGTNDGTICAGGSVTLTASGGTSYVWGHGPVTAAVTVSPATTTPYTVTVTDANGCKAIANQTVSVNPLPTASFVSAPVSATCAGTDVTYTTEAGQSNYTWTLPPAAEYTITGGSTNSNTITLHWNTAGTKTVKVNYTNSNGCSAASPATTTTTVNALPTLGSVSASTTEVCSGSSATITLTGLLPNVPQTITYTINGGQAETVSITANGSGVATFNTIALSSANSGDPLVITGITRTDVTPACNSINPANAQTTLPTVTNTDLIAPTIEKPAAIDVSSVCVGQSLTINVTAPGSGGVSNQQDEYRYSTNGGTTWTAWSTTIPNFSAVAGTNIIEARRTATGGVCGSSGSNTLTWTVTTMPTVTGPTPATQELCLNATVTPLTVTVTGGNGAFSYQWYSNTANSNSGGTLINGETNATFTPSSATPGTTYYYCIVTQAGVGCGAVPSATASVVVAPMPVSGTLTKLPDVPEVCRGTDVAATATAGSGGAGTTADVLEYRYDGTGPWSSYTSGAAIATTGHTLVEIRTFHTATSLGCTSSTPVVVSWTINPRPTVGINVNETPLTGANDGTICTGGSITLTANGSNSKAPYAYSWVTGATTIATVQTVTVNPTANTDYLVTVTDDNGCTNTKTFTVTVNALPTPAISINESPLVGTNDGTICAGGSVTLTASGGTTYAWDHGPVTAAVTVNPATTTPYGVTVTDANGCMANANQTVSVNPLPVVSFVSAPVSATCVGTDVTYTTQAGQSNYAWTLPAASEYTITGGSTNSNTITLHWNTAGAKTVKVNYTNSDGCAAASPATTTTTVNALPTISGVTLVTAVCESGTTQTTSLNYTSTANTPTSYGIDWSDAANAAGLADQANGAFSFNPGAGSINNISIPANTLGGTYSGVLTITNNNGCSTSQNISVTVSPFPFLTMDPAAAPVCYSASAQSTTLAYSFAYASPNTYSITWDPSPSNSFAPVTNASLPANQIPITVPAATAPGTYTGTITVRNTTGCVSAPVTFTVTVNPLPAVAPITGTTSVCIGKTTTLSDATANGTWSSSNTAVATIDAAGVVTAKAAGTTVITYTTAADGNGCTNSTTTTVTVNALPTIVVGYTGPGALTSVCFNAAGQTTAMAYVSTGNSPTAYSIDWDNAANAAGLADQGNTNFAFVPGSGTMTGILVTAGTPPGTYNGVLTISNANGCTGTLNIIFTVNPVTAIATQPVGATYCQNATTVAAMTVSATGTAPLAYKWYSNTSNTNTGGTIISGASLASYTPSVSTAGTFYYYVEIGGPCGTVVSNPVTIVVNPVTVISSQSTAGATYCQNATATALSVTATGTGTLTYQWYSNTSASNTGGTLISGATAASYTPSTTTAGTKYYYVIVSGSCGTVTSLVSGAIAVNPLPTATISGTTTVCQNAPAPLVTFTGSNGTAPYTFTYSVNGGAPQTVSTTLGNSVTVSQPTGTAGTFTYTLVSVKDATSTQCSQAQSGTAVITVNATPVGGTISPAITTVCSNAPGGTLTLSGYSGSIIRWESSVNGGTTWTSIANTTASQTYTTTGTTVYRAVVQNGVCAIVYSSNAVVSVIPPATTPTATANPSTICAGQTATLSATAAGYLLASDMDGTFNQANPAGWIVKQNGTEINFPANADNANTFPWSETNGPKQPFNGGVIYNNLQTDGKFAIASGLVNTTLETPVFSTIGMSSAALQFYQALVFAAGASGTIEISTNGGASYSKTLIQYNGPLTIGVPANNWAPLNIDLTDYIGLSNLRIRFTYAGADNSNWAIDGMKIAGLAPAITYQWTPTATLTPSDGLGQTVTASPTTTTTYTVTTTINGCPGGSKQVTVVVNPVPTATIAVNTTATCQGGTAATVTFTGAGGTAPYTFTYQVNGGANQTVTTTGGNSSVTVQQATTTPGTYTYTLVSVQDNSSTKCIQAQSGAVSIRVNPLPTATASGTATVCQNAPAPSVTFTGATGTAPYTFTYTLFDGVTTTTKTVVSSGNSATVQQPTTTAGVYTYTLVSVQDASSTTCSANITGQSVTITVNETTIISTQSAGGTYCQNAMAPLAVTVKGTNLTYQWYSNSTNSNTGGTPVGTNSNTFTPPATVGTTYYYVVITGTCGSYTGAPIPVTVVSPPEISQLASLPPQCRGSKLTLAVIPKVASDISGYQWFKDGQPIPGATSSTYTITSMSATDDGSYSVVAYGLTPCGNATSGPTPLTSYESDVTIWNSGLNTTEWHQDLNWTCKMPNLYRDAIVPIVPNGKYPYIDAGLVGQTRDLRIDAGGPTVTLEGTLQMAGEVTNNGTLDAYLKGPASKGMIEFVSNNTFSGYPNNPTYAQNLVSTGGTPVTQTQHLKISNQVSFAIPVDVYGQLSFGGSNKTLATGDKLTLKSVSSTISAMVVDRTNGTGVEQNNLINGKATVERFIDGALGRRWRLVTAPVSGINVNQAWQEGSTWDGNGTLPSTHYSTLITGNMQGTAATANANGFDFWSAIASGSASIRFYQGAPDWHQAIWAPLPSTRNAWFNSIEAYLVYVRGDRSITTGSNQTTLHPKGPLKELIAHTVTVMANQSHTLIGNPYASPLNFFKIYTDNSSIIQPYFWVWQASLGVAGGYILIKPVSDGSSVYESVPDGGTTVSASDPIISSGEGFFVMPKDGVSLPANISIKQTHKDPLNSSVSVFRLPGKEPAKMRLNVYATDGTAPTLLDGAQAEFGTEAQKLGNIAKAINSSENLSIRLAGRDMIVTSSGKPKEGDTVQLRLWNTTAKEYQLQISTRNFNPPLATGLSAVLVDRYGQKETPVSLQGGITKYTFRIGTDAASKNQQRIYVVFRRGVAAPVPVPPVVVTLDARQQGRTGVQVDWQTLDEKEVKSYELQRSKDGTQFTGITSVDANGTAGPQTYQHLDPSPFFPYSYYRLRVVKENGEESYTGVVKVALQEEPLRVYPNPVKAGEVLTVELRFRPQGTYTFRLFTPTGQLVMQNTLKHGGGGAIIWLPLGTQLASGYYTLEVARPDGKTEKLSVNVLR